MAEKKNVSSGAAKAEKLAKKPSAKNAQSNEQKELKNLADNSEGTNKKSVKSTKSTPKKATKNATKKGGAKQNKRSSSKRASRAERKKQAKEKRRLRLQRRAEHRLERKKLAAEKKQKRLERKLAHKEKIAQRKAELAEKRAQRKAEKQKRRDMIKHESKEKRAKRIAEEKKARREARLARKEKAIEARRNKREQRNKAKEQKRTHRDKQRAPGFGGWLAAVISLGVTTLALGTILTFGWLNMGDMQADIAGGYTQSLYELNAIVDDLDTDLARAKASSSPSDRVRVFTDIAVESENAELILERFPLEMQTTERLTDFINGMGQDVRGMLYTVANGGELTAKQIKALENMYTTNAKVKTELNKLIESTSEQDMLNAMNGKDCALIKGFTQIQNNVFEEQLPASGAKAKTPAYLEGEEEITASRAETIAKNMFGDYKVSEAKCVGEATGIIPLYNVNLTVPDGEMLVQISKAGGKLVAFDSFKECTDHNFSVDRCVAIAEDFLVGKGYNGLKAVWASENGTTCNLHFATVEDGVIIYSDLVKVKVCEERGIVTGLDAGGYVLRHKDRQIAGASISEAQAKSSINGNIAVSSTRLAVIPVNGSDKLCYEFFGEMDGVEYYVYVDAQTGEELEVKTVVGTAQGKIIK